VSTGSSAVQQSYSGEDHLPYSLTKLALLHLAPGVAILALYLALVPLVRSNGWPPLFALLLAAFFGAVPVQLGHLFLVGRKLNHRLSLVGVLGNNSRLPKWQYFAFVPLLCVIAIIVLLATAPIDAWLTRTVFAGLPSWYFYSNPAVFASYPRKILAITFGLRIMIDGLILPFVEELYFRAYLLPRLDRFGRWAPAINHGLFYAVPFLAAAKLSDHISRYLPHGVVNLVEKKLSSRHFHPYVAQSHKWTPDVLSCRQ
jgi:uncharacterized protein